MEWAQCIQCANPQDQLSKHLFCGIDHGGLVGYGDAVVEIHCDQIVMERWGWLETGFVMEAET